MNSQTNVVSIKFDLIIKSSNISGDGATSEREASIETAADKIKHAMLKAAKSALVFDPDSLKLDCRYKLQLASHDGRDETTRIYIGAKDKGKVVADSVRSRYIDEIRGTTVNVYKENGSHQETKKSHEALERDFEVLENMLAQQLEI